MRDVHVLLGGGQGTSGAFLRDGALVVTAAPRWVHFFASPRGGDSVWWDAGGSVSGLHRSREGNAAICTTHDGRAYRLWLEGESIADEEISPDAAALLADLPIWKRIGRRLFVWDDGHTYIVDPELARRARLLRDWEDQLVDATDDGATVAIVHEGMVLIGDIDESRLEWHAVQAACER